MTPTLVRIDRLHACQSCPKYPRQCAISQRLGEEDLACPLPQPRWGPFVASQHTPAAIIASAAEQLAEKGRAAWGVLHPAALKGIITPQWLSTTFRPLVQALGMCGCLPGWDDILAANPLPTDPADHFAWTVLVHNLVNRKLGHDELTVDQAVAIWSTPAADSSTVWQPPVVHTV